jgi:hypothetical protein
MGMAVMPSERLSGKLDYSLKFHEAEFSVFVMARNFSTRLLPSFFLVSGYE